MRTHIAVAAYRDLAFLGLAVASAHRKSPVSKFKKVT
jgi:hypothetical protein